MLYLDSYVKGIYFICGSSNLLLVLTGPMNEADVYRANVAALMCVVALFVVIGLITTFVYIRFEYIIMIPLYLLSKFLQNLPDACVQNYVHNLLATQFT